MADLLYEVDKNCPVCANTFKVTKVRSRLVMKKQDTDFCTYYQEVNPYYYLIWVCPHCGFAAQEKDFEQSVHASVKKFLSGRKVNIDFSGTRTVEQAINAYKLAIFYGEMAGTQNSKLAGLYLRLGWLYRESARETEEKAALQRAIDNYEKSMDYERFPIGGMSEVSMNYLLGELYRRVDKIDVALSYYNRVVSSPMAKSERRILDMARNAWQDARDLKKQLTDDAG